MVCAILNNITERSVILTLQTMDGTAQSRFINQLTQWWVTMFLLVIAWCYVAGPGDYTEVISRQLSFQPGTTQLCTPINITDDAILEDSETFTVQLNATDQSVILSPSSSTVPVTILDNNSESGLNSHTY